MKKHAFYLTQSIAPDPVSPISTSVVFQHSLRSYNNYQKIEDPKVTEKFARLTDLQLQKRQKKINQNKRRHLDLKKRFLNIEELLKNAAAQLEDQKKEELLMEKASIKIQKVFRGFIQRKKLEPRVYSVKKEKMDTNIKSMKEDKNFLMFNVGRMPEISAVIIQKAYKRYRARCYFERLLQTYKLIQQQKEEENFKNLREKIWFLACINKKKNKAFEKYRKDRLVGIKEKLAIIKLKILFKRLNLKKKIIFEKIKKYKRRLRAAQKRRARKLEALRRENENLTEQELQNIENLSMHSEEDFETTTSDREAEERAELMRRLEEDRKTRIHFGKISHNLRELKLPKILTSLHQQEVPLVNLTPVQLNKKVGNRRYSVIKDDFPIRKRDGEEPSYMRATISFNLSKFASKIDDFEEERNTNYGQIRDNSTLFEQTKASLLKISNKKRSLSAEDDPGESIKKASVKFISVKIREKPKKVGIKKGLNAVVVNRNEVSTDAFNLLPGISTRHQNFPVKVKPRAGLMRGFTKTRKKSDFFYD